MLWILEEIKIAEKKIRKKFLLAFVLAFGISITSSVGLILNPILLYSPESNVKVEERVGANRSDNYISIQTETSGKLKVDSLSELKKSGRNYILKKFPLPNLIMDITSAYINFDKEFLIVFVAVLVIFAILVRYFITAPLSILMINWFRLNDLGYDSISFNDLKKPLEGRGYINIVKVMFFKELFIHLWMLVLIIPGIAKNLEYMFVELILSEYPEMNRKEALKFSKTLAIGKKGTILLTTMLINIIIFILFANFSGNILIFMLLVLLDVIVNTVSLATLSRIYNKTKQGGNYVQQSVL